MVLLSFRSLLLYSILVAGAEAQSPFAEERLAEALLGNWHGEEKYPFFESIGDGEGPSEYGIERFCSRISMDAPGFRTYFAAEGICEVRLSVLVLEDVFTSVAHTFA